MTAGDINTVSYVMALLESKRQAHGSGPIRQGYNDALDKLRALESALKKQPALPRPEPRYISSLLKWCRK
ncbi:hypothetical protein [Janthinobacterium sp. CG3]|uniref:hypothetical protein n=1 Tax=Janthinobacterium sp. CG3 TaxID=1075768 RepID=UPI00034DECAA|nr:hypothetical protein [Janthinobacterium sp. CG3]